jgi:hypothetical protein
LTKKINKSDLITELLNILDDRHWNLFSRLVGRDLKRTQTSRANFLKSRFKKTIGISSRKGKARELQKWVCEQISHLTGIPCGKDEEITSREMGQGGTDTRLSKRVLALFPFSVECKNQESWSIPSWISQAKKNQLPETDWLIFITKNGYEEICILDAKVFFSILKKEK